MKLIVNCLEENCPRDWDSLSGCGESHLKFCTHCFRKVTLVGTCEDLEARKSIGEKAAIDECLTQAKTGIKSA
jgi:hypothetical protein